jgi:hypothetical protein
VNFRIWAAIAVLALTGLAGCETTAVYQAQAGRGGQGYTDKQLAENRYRVAYHGSSATSRETVEDFLLRRAAEVTLKAGYPAFLFDHRDTKTKTRYYSDFAGWPGWPGYGWYWHSWDFGLSEAYPISNYTAYAEIVLLKDDQAAKEPRALRAQDVLDHLGPLPAPMP